MIAFADGIGVVGRRSPVQIDSTIELEQDVFRRAIRARGEGKIGSASSRAGW